MQAASRKYSDAKQSVSLTIVRLSARVQMLIQQPAEYPRPKGLGAAAGPNPPYCFNNILRDWYNAPPAAGTVLERY